MNRVLSSLASKGTKVILTGEEKPRTMAVVDGQNIPSALWESSKRCEHIPSKSEAEKTKDRGYRTYELWDFEPTGRLTLEIGHWGFWGVRTKWCDRQSQPLESQIDSFLDGLKQAAVKAREVEEERERERRVREIEEERRFAEQCRREEERRRLEGLKDQASGLRQSRMIRDLVDELRRRGQDSNVSAESGSPLGRWLAWATKCADDLDPVGHLLTSFRPAVPHPASPLHQTNPVTSGADGVPSEGNSGSSSPFSVDSPAAGPTVMGDASSRKYDRKTLYEQVWAEPVQKVAKVYGISGRGLAKVCARLRVPVPPRGYWARVRNGHKARKPPLPSNAALRSV